jgi:lipoprotein-releasing system ATP-binding protein
MALVEIDSVVKQYGLVKALDGLSLQMEEGKQYVIQGASGSGKSTLFYLIGGLERPSQGRVSVDGKNLAKLSDKDLANYRNRFLGFVFQFHFLLPSMNCMKNILLPAQIGGLSLGPVKKNIQVIAEYLGVSHCLKKYPYELSGGEQQRINIIRALSLRPKLLLCDEPTGNLDSQNSAKVVQLLKNLSKEFGATLAIVTHDLSIAEQFDTCFQLKDGKMFSEKSITTNGPPAFNA